MSPRLRHTLGKRHCVISAALFCVALGLFLLAHVGLRLPVSNEAARQTGALRALMDDLASTEMRFHMSADYVDKSARIAALEDKLKPSLSEPEFTAEMEGLVERSGVALEQFSSRRRESMQGVDTTAYDLLLAGSYPQIKAFLSGAAGLNGFVSIRRVAIEKRASGLRANVLLLRHQRMRGGRDA